MDADPDVDMVCGSRFLDRRPATSPPISRRTGIHIFAFLLSRLVGQRVTDPTSGFRLYNRRAIELFARDYPHDYPEVEAVLMLHHHRLRMREVPVRMFAARRRRLLDHARASPPTTWSRSCSRSSSGSPARGPSPSPATPAPVAAEHGHLMDDPDPDRRHPRRRARCCWSCSSWCAAGGCSSATRCCGCSARVVLLGLAVWRDALERARQRASASPHPPNALFFVALRLHPAAAAALLGRGLAADRPDARSSPSASRCSRSACTSSQRERDEDGRRGRGRRPHASKSSYTRRGARPLEPAARRPSRDH